ncbi:MAG: MFS transporter [Nocardioidaceae bacterium]|nr:MFS transporter [Nocardioidaceae bacterium]
MSASAEPDGRVDALARLLLGLAAGAVAFAAADTYVVVLALPDMMAAAGLSTDELQRAAPLISGFLLGYVGVLPLIGRIADLRGRTPVLVGSLVVFAVGSLVTAAAYDLTSMVVGRFLQGVGGGGLVPATLALVADLWPPARRGLPLGVVGAVQEVGAVLGPLYGALVLAVGDWRAIFWLNLAVGLVLAAALLRVTAGSAGTALGRVDWVGAGLAVATLGVVSVVMREPDVLVTDVQIGRLFLPIAGDSRWATPLALVAYAGLGGFCLRQAAASRPLLAWRRWREVLVRTDLWGALLLGTALGGVIVAFASADPEVAALDTAGVGWLVVAAVAGVLFGWRQRVGQHPLVPHGCLRPAAAWGAVAVSFFVGAALIAALVDIPFLARLTVYPDSQLDAALVLVRFLAALPVGALVGGWLTRWFAAGPVTATGMAMAATGFVLMARWGADALESWTATGPLVLAGFGFGLAVAPVNAALLAATDHSVHGVTSALLVVSRMVGMLVGISALTTIGLRRFYVVAADVPPVEQLCPRSPTDCPAYSNRLLEAGLAQLDAVFMGAAGFAIMAGLLALATLRTPSPEAHMSRPPLTPQT